MHFRSSLVFAFVSLLLSACAGVSSMEYDDELVAASSAPQFEFLKSLEGVWVGTANAGGQMAPTEVHYRVTGGGSAVEEVLFPGTEHEMVSIYHRDGPFLLMTHYCSAGNQPRMRASWTDPPPRAGAPMQIRFEFLDATNLPDPDVLHMHATKFESDARGGLKTTWTAYLEGEPNHSAVFELRRKDS
jgi:hypothetical protein